MNQNPKTATEIEIQPQVTDWFDRLEKEITLLNDMACRVSNRFESVMRAQPPATDCAQNVPEEYLVTMADRLRAQHRSVQKTNDILASIMERVEL